MSSLIRDLARRALGITRLDRDIRLLADALIALDRRVDEIDARLGEFIVGAARGTVAVMNAQERAARAVLRPRSGQITVAPIDPPSRTAGEAPGTSTPPGVSPTAHDWWTDHDALAELWRWLEDRGQEPNDVAYYLERPWKWTPEYDDMRSEQTALP